MRCRFTAADFVLIAPGIELSDLAQDIANAANALLEQWEIKSLLDIVEDLARPDKMSETAGTMLRRFEDLRIRAQKILGKEGEGE